MAFLEQAEEASSAEPTLGSTLPLTQCQQPKQGLERLHKLVGFGDGGVHLLQEPLEIALKGVGRAAQRADGGCVEVVLEVVLEVEYLVAKLAEHGLHAGFGGVEDCVPTC